jgi:hypothetical protein
MSSDPNRIIVVACCCDAYSSNKYQVHHRMFPEMQIGGMSVEQAVSYLVERLTSDLDCVSDTSHREAVWLAIADARAFLDREGSRRHAHDASPSNAP